MKILGITNNDLSGACLVDNDTIVAAVSEERFTRIKDHKVWPMRSIEYVLNEGDTSIEDVNKIAYGWSAGFSPTEHLPLYINRAAELARDQSAIDILLRRAAQELTNDAPKRNEISVWVNLIGARDKFRQIDHHRCHALGAFCTSPFDDALVITSDARGDFQSMTVSTFLNGKETVLHRETSSDSLGYFYGRITHLLGFKPNRHEGKVAGLSAYGDKNSASTLIEKMILVDGPRIRASLGDYYSPFYDEIADVLRHEAALYSPQDLAAAAQYKLEISMITIIEYFIRETGISNLCLGGGVFANVALNQKIAESPLVTSIYVLPCMGDGGLALAAAVAIPYIEKSERVRSVTMKLGPRISDAEIFDNLEKMRNKISSQELSSQELCLKICTDLLDNLIVGFARGRSEFGPRALGNRSILALPRYQEMHSELNRRLDRTDIMPFAPVIPEPLARTCLVGWNNQDACTPYMTRTFKATKFFKERCPAAIHVDGTARPQVIGKDDDPILFDLLMLVFDKSNCPALINTSFNVHEEPIVLNSWDCMSALIDCRIDVLYFNDHMRVLKQERYVAK